MPIYEYVCQSCRHQFEVKQKFSDDPIASCIRCGQAVMKIISAPAIMFKGSGWYVTDYSDKLKAPGQSTAPDSTAKSGNGTGEAKPSSSESKSDSSSQSSSTPASSGSGETGSKATPSTTPTSTASS